MRPMKDPLILNGRRAYTRAADASTGASRPGEPPVEPLAPPIPAPEVRLLLHAEHATSLHRLSDGGELWSFDAVGGE